jgi:hypothetical protein
VCLLLILLSWLLVLLLLLFCVSYVLSESKRRLVGAVVGGNGSLRPTSVHRFGFLGPCAPH